MIPLRDENPVSSFPLVTLALIIVNVAVFIYELALGQRLAQVVQLVAVVPSRMAHPVAVPDLLPVLTSLFFHAGFLHLGGNMLFLWVFGNNIEDRLGRPRFLAFYLACGIAATLGHVLLYPRSEVPLIGASGAVSGVLGAYLVLYPRAKVLVLLPLLFLWPVGRLEAGFFLLFWILMQFVYGAASFMVTGVSKQGGPAWGAHISGIVSGIVFLKLLDRLPKRRRAYAAKNH